MYNSTGGISIYIVTLILNTYGCSKQYFINIQHVDFLEICTFSNGPFGHVVCYKLYICESHNVNIFWLQHTIP